MARNAPPPLDYLFTSKQLVQKWNSNFYMRTTSSDIRKRLNILSYLDERQA